MLRFIRRFAAALLALAFLGEETFAEPRPIRFVQYTTLQGFSQSTVNAIIQDRQGFLWFGTQDGLKRFDRRTWKFTSQAVAKALREKVVPMR